MEFWAGHLVAGRPTECDRDAEFVATGEVSTLVERVQRARELLRADLATLDPAAPLRNPPDPEDAHLPFGRTQGTALLHLHRELAPHLGQMEGCRDVLTQGQARLAPSTS